MNVEGLDKINIGELKKLFSIDTKSLKEALPILRKFRDEHSLNDDQARIAFSVSRKIFGK